MIWNVQDRLECHAKLQKVGMPPILPFYHVKVDKGKETIVKEKIEEDTIITNLNINFVMGISGLVDVAFWKNDVQICPAMVGESIVGDSQTIEIQEMIQAKEGDELSVKIKNNDKKYDHIIGVRIDVR